MYLYKNHGDALEERPIYDLDRPDQAGLALYSFLLVHQIILVGGNTFRDCKDFDRQRHLLWSIRRRGRRGIKQIGFARVITDKTTFGYLADVFIDETHRGQGLSKWMIEIILSHPNCRVSVTGN
jgi:GNAT superfamily N-acetyltransferase